MAATVMVAPAMVERITRALATVVDRTRSPPSDALPSTHSSVRAGTAQLRTMSAGMKMRLCRTRSNRSRIRFLIAPGYRDTNPRTAKNDGTRYGRELADRGRHFGAQSSRPPSASSRCSMTLQTPARRMPNAAPKPIQIGFCVKANTRVPTPAPATMKSPTSMPSAPDLVSLRSAVTRRLLWWSVSLSPGLRYTGNLCSTRRDKSQLLSGI